MKWYFPSMHGDIRVESHPDSPDRSLLTIISPTTHEQKLLDSFAQLFITKKWFNEPVLWQPSGPERQTIALECPLTTIGPLLVDNFKAGEATLTAVVFRDGRVETVSGSGSEARDLVAAAAAATTAAAQPKAAATVKRPTPCCPTCETGQIDAATEVLYDFLSPNERDQWEREALLEIEGGMTGHRYLVMHRKSKLAARYGKFIFDVTDGCVVHCHDTHVPPPEEVLAGKLILEHHEDWLRNEATLFDADAEFIFKNPFGDLLDGTESASATKKFGELMLAFAANGGRL